MLQHICVAENAHGRRNTGCTVASVKGGGGNGVTYIYRTRDGKARRHFSTFMTKIKIFFSIRFERLMYFVSLAGPDPAGIVIFFSFALFPEFS